MDNKDLNGLSIRKVVEEYNIPSIGDEMILFDHFNDVPLPNEPRRMECSMFAICLKGKAQYTVNTNRHTVKENDVIIVNEGQVVGDYMLSRDCEGIAIMLSEEFLNEITSGINELSSLFLFSRDHPVFSLDASVTKTMLGYLGLIKQYVAEKKPAIPLKVLGPSPCTLGRINNRYRYRIIIKCRVSAAFRELIEWCQGEFLVNRKFSEVRCTVDINGDIGL